MSGPVSFSGVLGSALLVVLLAFYGAAGYVAPYVALALTVIAAIHVGATRRVGEFRPDAAMLAFAAAFCLLGLAFAVSAHRPADLLVIFNFAWLLLFAPLRTLLRRLAGPNAAVVVARLALAGTLLTLLLALYEHVAFGNGRVGRLTSDPIRIANTAVILGFLSLIGIVADRGALRFVYLAGPALTIAVALFAQTRGAIASSAMVAALAVLVLIPRRRHAIIAAIVMAVAGVAAILLAAHFHIARTDSLVRSVTQAFSGEPITNRSAMRRFEMLRVGWLAFLDQPWFGHGWQRLIAAVEPHLRAGQEKLMRRQPHLHNDLMDFAVAGGVTGVTAYLLILFAPLAAALRSARDTLYRPRLVGVALVTGSYAVLGINSLMFGFEVHTALFVGLSAILLGFCRDAPVTAKPAGTSA